MSRGVRAKSVLLTWNGIPAYEVDLGTCWRALLGGPGGERVASYGALAEKAGTGRSTVSEFFRGKTKSVAVGRLIIAALGLEFDQVARRVEPEAASA